MKIKIQHFTLSLFLLLSLVLVLLWSLSLFRVMDSANEKTLQLHRDNLQIQLDQLQLTQQLWLQQRFSEVSEWLSNNTDPQQRLHFINQYYQRYPQLRLIQLNQPASLATAAGFSISSCHHLSGGKLPPPVAADMPVILGCMFNQQPMLGIAAVIPRLREPQELVLLLEYFSFLDNFEQLTGKHFYHKKTSGSTRAYVESAAGQERQHQLKFEFTQGELNVGSVSVAIPMESFWAVWQRQAIWLIPALLVITLILYRVLFRALIHPLFMITRRMQKVVLTRRPGHADDSRFLTPGLLLLHRYFMHLTHLAKHDPLTGLNNRVIFEERLQRAILEGKRSGRKYALVLVDINHFYNINRKMGNYIGDGLLKQLARRLTSGLRETDSLARLGGDNFALLLEFTDDDRIRSLVEKIHQSLSQPYTVYGREVKAEFCVGVAVYPDHAQEMDELELKANEALLKAQDGEWPVEFSQQSGDATDYSGLSLIQSLRQALENNEFKLVYQPVMDLKYHTTSYFEALLRWKQPERHTQPIEKTIELAEKNQLIKPLSQWIIQQACLQLTKLADTRIKIAVNLSMIDLHDEDLPGRVGDTLSRCGVSPARLMIEITEGQIMQEPDQVIQILTRLADMGISLSIDDFGTGQASLTYLKKLPVEKLKIDQSFVKDMVTDEEDSAIVEATIKLAHTLGIEVVAEGVESAEIHALLLQMGCDFVQGYYISRPIDMELIPDWIIENGSATLQSTAG